MINFRPVTERENVQVNNRLLSSLCGLIIKIEANCEIAKMVLMENRQQRLIFLNDSVVWPSPISFL